MSVDRIFKQLEKKTERDLFRQTMKIAKGSHDKVMQQVFSEKKKIWTRRVARELLWFFGSILIGFLLGFLLYKSLVVFFPETHTTFLTYFGGNYRFLYFYFALCFLGVYVTRITIWALKLFS
jgi:hypothetical protein